MEKTILGLLLGAVLMYFAYPHIPKDEEKKDYPIEFAKVEDYKEILVFVESEPVDMDKFELIGELDSRLLENSLKEIFGKKKSVWDVVDGFTKGISFKNKLETTLDLVQKKYADQNPAAIILDDGFEECKVYKLKKD